MVLTLPHSDLRWDFCPGCREYLMFVIMVLFGKTLEMCGSGRRRHLTTVKRPFLRLARNSLRRTLYLIYLRVFICILPNGEKIDTAARLQWRDHSLLIKVARSRRFIGITSLSLQVWTSVFVASTKSRKWWRRISVRRKCYAWRTKGCVNWARTRCRSSRTRERLKEKGIVTHKVDAQTIVSHQTLSIPIYVRTWILSSLQRLSILSFKHFNFSVSYAKNKNKYQ